jgi:2,4-dienoyl-CoA reductase-like NADH-dependent reductase (Old Yellow Enzyme family)
VPALFTPFASRGVTLRNRIVVSPMCQYAAVDGLPSDWHLVHLGALAHGGAGLLLLEATAVEPAGRITPACLGLWSNAHAEALAPIVGFCRDAGIALGIQLAHAGRKASHDVPWRGGGLLAPSDGGWDRVAPSPVSSANEPPPLALDEAGLARVRDAFASAARRAVGLGFQVIELHAGHGYLLHSFLSPLANRRTDDWGGDLPGRARLLREVARAVRSALPPDRALWVRLSATDWVEGGFDLDEAVVVSRWLREDGVDLIDVSSGGMVPGARIPVGPGYQVPLAARIRAEAAVPTAAVGMIDDPAQAEAVVAEGRADLVALGRAMLREPRWAWRAAAALGVEAVAPVRYLRAAPHLRPPQG